MQFKLPKSDKYHWTRHSLYKMRQYGLSPQRVTRVIRNPERTEEGIVPKTIAVMQPASVRHRRTSAGKPAPFRSKQVSTNKPTVRSWSQEIWVMYQLSAKGGKVQSSKLKVQSRILNSKFQNLQTPHPTLSPLGRGGKGKIKVISAWRYPGISPKNNPIPEEILREIRGVV